MDEASLKKAVAELEDLKLALDLQALSPRVKKRRLVLFFGRPTFSDNSKYLYLHALAREHGYEVRWCCFEKEILNELAPHKLPTFNLGANLDASIELLLHAAVAVFCINPAESLRYSGVLAAAVQGARRVQLWHGISVKQLKLGLLPHFTTRENVFRRAIEIGTRFEYLVSTAQCFDAHWHRWFGATQLVRTGHPRNEVIMRGPQPMEMLGAQVDAALQQALLGTGRKKVLVVPTWQRHQTLHTTGAEFVAQLARYAADRGVDFFFKLHPMAYKPGDAGRSVAGVHMLSPGLDVYPWLSAFDALVTDYSSLMFDFLLTGKPILTLDIPPGRHRNFEPDWSLVPEGDFRFLFTPETFERQMDRTLNEDHKLPGRIAFAQKIFETDPNLASEQLMTLVDQLVEEAVADRYGVVAFNTVES